MLELILNFVAQYESVFIILGIVSAVVFVITLLFTPYLLGLIPVDYFVGNNKSNSGNLLVKIIKNMMGILLILAGLIMLVTPGQGVVSILLGLFLMQFPGKRKLERKMVHHETTFKTLNWLRAKANKPEFKR